jgi:bacterioferritin-associated ferredoxin
MTETTVGREPIQIVEIKQPLCSRVYGVAPCTAVGPDAGKCFNTRATCQDVPNFLLGTPLSLFFSTGNVAEQQVSGATYIIPSLVSVSTSPTRINLAGANPDAQGLGNRALCSIVFQDHTHTDRVVDPYISGRGYDALELGSFWTKWIIRNRYRQNIEIVVYEGYAGQALSAMSKRTYFFDSIQGPDDGGRITIQGKDVLARIEERKAQAPVASPGVLFAAITNVDTTLTVSGALITDYPATGTIRIETEIMTYTGRSASGDNLVFTGLTRGTDNSLAAAHTVNQQVQLCLRITNARIDDTIALFMQTYGGISATFLDLTGWAAEIDSYMGFWTLTALITTPTGVNDLVSAVQEQTLVYCWWDEKVAKVKMQSVRGVDVEPPLLTAESHIIAGSFKLTEQPKERVSQVWVYYDQRDKAKSPQDDTNYNSVAVVANLVEEALYGEPSIRKIYGNFLSFFALAGTTASKIITRYVYVPSTLQFRLDAKDRGIWVGSTVKISHPLDVDVFGNRRIRQWLITSAQEIEPGETIECVASDTTLYGKIYFIMASGSADYPGPDLVPFKSGYIGNADGLLSDGSIAARIT